MKKIIVKAPILSRSGYGEHARFLMRSLRKYEGSVFDIYAVNINWGKTSWQFRDTEERRWIDSILQKTLQYTRSGGRFDISAQVTIPNEWERIAPINIGVTAGIETTKVSPTWIEKSMLMDKIIVVSDHSKNVYLNTSYEATNNQTGEVVKDFRCKTPIDVVHYPVKTLEPQEVGLEFSTKFNFLAMAQWSPRKNFDNTIDWFMEEFKDDADVGLVLKTFLVNNSHMDKQYTLKKIKSVMSKYPDHKCKVYLIHGSMSDEEITGLYNHPQINSLITLTHGEGFGLPIFEAAYSGLPVIAPDWSGHVDFLHMPVKDKKGRVKNKAMFGAVDYTLQPIEPGVVWKGVLEEGSMWAYAEKVSYKKRLRQMKEDYGRFTGFAKKLKKYLHKYFNEDEQYDEFVNSIIGGEVEDVKIKTEDLPKISILTSVYDGDEFIRPFLEDMTRQTIFKEKCELILINANSPGNEEEVIKEYMEKYPDNIVYKKLDEDPGIYGTWNIGVEMATGEYLTNANLDDRKAPNSLEKHALTLYTNEDIELAYADSFITHVGNEVFEENSSNGQRYNFEQFSVEGMLRGNLPHNNPMWKKSMHEKHGLFDANYKSAGDWDFFTRCAIGGSKFKKINEVLGLYFFNPKGVSTNKENEGWKRKEEIDIFKKHQKAYSKSKKS